ncbi:MAG: serine/threonine-protein kinase PknK, partial [Gammaproteobacteria bacterium]
MDNLIGYNQLEQLYVGESIVVYRAIREMDGRSVILKMLKEEYPDPADIARLIYEYNLLKDLTITDIVRTEGFEKQQHHYAIVLEDIPNSCTLREFLFTHKLSIEDFLQIAIQLAAALDQLHETHIIHKDINPDNILITKDGKQIKLIDLSIATQLSEEEQVAVNPEVLEGTLPYISPEQTTRMNRSIDRRTDLYSLGITFYEMLVGRLPFEANDAIEWVSYHIAKQPVPPHDIIADIPEMVSKIILKLLAKSAEDRYNTAEGVKKDLQICLTAWEKDHTIPAFTLGVQDRAGMFHIPQKLFGREKEAYQLLEVFEKINRGAREVLFVEGQSGIGKSSLINEIQKPIIRQRGYFITGKYEQYQKDLPYDGLIQAFRNLIQQILTESKQRVNYWRDQLNKAISPNGQVIINVIPEVEKLIGKQLPIVELPPTEARTRFELVFFDFVRTFSRKDHPLVLFLDDMQWADTGSFNLLTQLLQDTEVNYFFLLCTYRNKEIATTHPIFEMKTQLEKANISLRTITLKPLTQKNVMQLLNETLNTEEHIDELAKLIMEKTAGNPYFVNLFLTSLYKNHQLTYDTTQGQWVWDIASLKNLPIADNVADLVINEISRLPEATQEALKIAACIGNQFSLATLIALQTQPAETMTRLLWIALEEKWIIPVSTNYKLSLDDANIMTNSMKIVYRFSHDRVQQALYSLISEEKRKEIHFKLGYLLLAEYSGGNESLLFNVVHHFSICLNLIKKPEEKLKIAELFSKAAYKAKFSIAYDVAVSYLQAALQLLGDKAWKEHHDLVFYDTLNLANCLYLSGSFEQADMQFNALLDKAKTVLEKVKIVQNRALAYTVQSKYTEAANIVEEGLRLLGIKLPHSSSKFVVVWELIKTKWLLKGKKPSDLLKLPIMQDPEKIMIMELLENMATYSLVANPGNYYRIACVSMRAIHYSLSYGNHPGSAQCYLHYALIEFIRGNVENAYELIQVSIKLCERYNPSQLGTIYLLGMRVFPWKMSYRECLVYLNKASQLNFESGNLPYYQYAAVAIISMMMLANYPMAEIEEKLKNYLSDYQYTRNDTVVFALKVYL